MNGVDPFTPLLQLNPPVLVRANGGPSVIDLAAFRCAAAITGNCSGSGNRTSHSSISGSFTATVSNRPAALPSHAARKLNDAKSTARQVSRIGDVAQRAHTTEVPGRRKGSIGMQQTAASTIKAKQRTANELTGMALARTADQPSYGATGSTPPTPHSASGRGVTPQSTAASGGTPYTSGEDHPAPAITVVAAAAAAPSDDETFTLNLPYLMRHIQDTGALLDMLFPLQTLQRPENDSGSSNTVTATATDGNEDEAEPATLVSVQTVSTAPASREAVMALHATLLARLEARRARPTGVCRIRRTIYADLFSELVRQITIEEPARGLLLARVRENEEHALQVHAALLREGENFVANKQLQETQSITMLTKRLSDLMEEMAQLEVQKHNLSDARMELERRFEEQRQARRALQQDELNYLRRTNQQLSLRLKMETERATAGGVAAATSGASGDGGSEENAAAATADTTSVAS
ncbi:putative 33 kDa inner dynein arm light chain axonemal [Leptomonas seymouri]|uniref:Putative 33 kDa inner dynein arm light chain axonemal n=1 Tax=Leptomonas seymouri TaxID=5684 RepID=A0A0N0P4G0_LEPSE|nr:putative 33 kDa inner dynein arm light chain axonemal [Leptomonas seymouri]|eukprot:KPI85249.1 putative 33 kDa inner dynein arm light chain axonemal [Leptomonas seymouri]